MSSIVKDINCNSSTSLADLKMPVISTSTTAPLKGKIAYDTTTNQPQFGNDSVWSAFGAIAPGTITSNLLVDTGVVVGTYGNSNNVSQVTVNSQGQVTSISNIPIAGSAGGTVTQVNTGTGLTGGPIIGTGTISLSNTTVTPGTYGSSNQIPVITLNQQGQITNASNAAVTTGNTFTFSLAQQVYLGSTGIILWSGAGLPNVTVSAGTLTITNNTLATQVWLINVSLYGGDSLNENVGSALYINTALNTIPVYAYGETLETGRTGFNLSFTVSVTPSTSKNFVVQYLINAVARTWSCGSNGLGGFATPNFLQVTQII